MNKIIDLSIIIPTRNRSHLISKSIERAFLNKGLKYEVIVSNNCSSDDTKSKLEIAKKKYKKLITINHEKILELSNHWDLVIKNYANGDFIIVLPDDDYVSNINYLSSAVHLLKKYPNIGLVFGRYSKVDEEGTLLSTYNTNWKKFTRGKEMFGSYNNGKDKYIPHLTSVFRKKTYFQVGGFDTVAFSPDMYLWLKIMALNDVAFINSDVARYLVHRNNLTKTLNPSLPYKDILMINELRNFLKKHKIYNQYFAYHTNRLQRILYRKFHSVFFKKLIFEKRIDLISLRRIKIKYFIIDYLIKGIKVKFFKIGFI